MSTFGNNNVQMFGNYTTRRMSNYGPRSNGMQMNNEMMFGRVSQQDARDMMMWQSMKPPEPSTFEKIMAVALPLLSIAGTIFAAIAGSRASTPAETTQTTTEEPVTTTTETPVTNTTETPVTNTTETPAATTTTETLPEGDPGNETANKLKGLLADGSEKCTIEGGKTGICKADTYEGKIILPDGQVIEDGKFPQELRMTLPAGYKGTMKLTLIDPKNGIYASSAKDRNFQVVIDENGNVTMKAITNEDLDALLKQHQAAYKNNVRQVNSNEIMKLSDDEMNTAYESALSQVTPEELTELAKSKGKGEFPDANKYKNMSAMMKADALKTIRQYIIERDHKKPIAPNLNNIYTENFAKLEQYAKKYPNRYTAINQFPSPQEFKNKTPEEQKEILNNLNMYILKGDEKSTSKQGSGMRNFFRNAMTSIATQGPLDK